MAVAFDQQSYLDLTTTNSWTHTPVGTPRGVLVLIAQTTASTDEVSAVTYGGVAMQRVQTNTDTAAEPGRSYVYFLGAGVPTGARTVSVTCTGSSAKTAWCITVTAARDTTVVAKDGVNENAVNPSVTLTTTSAFAGLTASVFYSGLATPADATIAAGASYTKLTGSSAGGRDFGNQAACCEYRVTSGANVVAGWTAANDDVAMSAVAVAEGAVTQKAGTAVKS